MAETMKKTANTLWMKPWLRGVLFGSLALNVAVIGMAAGVAWRFHGDDRDRRAPSPEAHSLAYIRALDGADKRAIRDAMRARLPDRAAVAVQMRQGYDAVLEVLRTEPLDMARLDALMAEQARHGAARQDIARAVFIEQIAQMDLAARLHFADRLAEELAAMDTRRAPRQEKRAKDKGGRRH